MVLVVLIEGQGGICCMTQENPLFLYTNSRSSVFNWQRTCSTKNKVERKTFSGVQSTNAYFVVSLKAFRAVKKECNCEHHLTNSLENMLSFLPKQWDYKLKLVPELTFRCSCNDGPIVDRSFRTFLLFTRQKLWSQHSSAWDIDHRMFLLNERRPKSTIARRKVFCSVSVFRARKCKGCSDDDFTSCFTLWDFSTL